MTFADDFERLFLLGGSFTFDAALGFLDVLSAFSAHELDLLIIINV
jgi:hypothetical protein